MIRVFPLFPFALSLSKGHTSSQEGLGFDRLSPNGFRF